MEGDLEEKVVVQQGISGILEVIIEGIGRDGLREVLLKITKSPRKGAF